MSVWGVFEQYFPGLENRWGKSTCWELKILKIPVHFISAFQNGKFVLPPWITAREDYMCNLIWKTLVFQFHCISHQGALFGFHGQRTFRNCSAYVRRWTSSHKIAESTSVCTEGDKYTDSNIFGRYAYNGSNNGRNSHIQRHCIFLL